MKVSIIIPVYNVATYIKRCLDSVAAQTYTGDMECILVDDCGTDNSMQIVREWIKRYCGPIHFQLTGHQTNRGLSAARNTGIVVAQGDYIFFLDSDDAITPDCIDTLILIAEKYPEAEFVQGNTVRGTGNVMHSSRYRCEVPEYCTDKDQLIALILSKTLICAWNKLIKRSFLIDKQVFFAEGLLHEDLLWSYNLAQKVCAAAFTNSETYSYYINQNSILTNNSTGHLKHRYESLKAVAMFILNDLQQDAKSVSKYHMQFLAGTFVGCAKVLPYLHSIKCWLYFWRLLAVTTWRLSLVSKTSWIAFLIAMMPPLCFLARHKGYLWRVQHYIVAKI